MRAPSTDERELLTGQSIRVERRQPKSTFPTYPEWKRQQLWRMRLEVVLWIVLIAVAGVIGARDAHRLRETNVGHSAPPTCGE